MTDDDIRDLLRTKAQEATVSADAWDRIAARLDEREHKVSQLPRRLAAVGAAAAVIAGIVVLANRPGDSGPVTHTTTTSATATTVIRPGSPIDLAARAWLAQRLPGVELGRIKPIAIGNGDAEVTFEGGAVETTLLLHERGTSWSVESATSDLVWIDNPTYDGSEIVAEAVPAVEGQLTTTFVIDGRDVPGGTNHVTHESRPLGHPVSGARSVAIRVVLVQDDGTTALSEVPATVLRDPAAAVGSYVAVWPATDSAGLATFQQQADNKRRTDLLDPQAVAGFALTELLPRGETSTGFRLGEFQLGDQTSGEVPYTLSDGGSGTVLLRRTAGDDTRIWYVIGVTSDALEVLEYRHEPGTLVIDVRSAVTGTLTMPGADAPIDVQAGQKVSISRPADNDIQTGAPVELRLLAKGRTLAVTAELPR